MIERDGTEQVIVCDDCGEWHDKTYDESEFRQMIEDVKAAGWKITPDDQGGWTHQCPDCKPSKLDEQKSLLGL